VVGRRCVLRFCDIVAAYIEARQSDDEVGNLAEVDTGAEAAADPYGHFGLSPVEPPAAETSREKIRGISFLALPIEFGRRELLTEYGPEPYRFFEFVRAQGSGSQADSMSFSEVGGGEVRRMLPRRRDPRPGIRLRR